MEPKLTSLEHEGPSPHDEVKMTPKAWAVGVAVVYIPLTVFSLLAMRWWVSPNLDDAIGFSFPALAVGAVVGAVIVGSSFGLIVASTVGREMGSAMAELIGEQPLAVCLWMALASSVGEELFFRGLLQPLIGPVWATALFAMAHVPMERRLWTWPFFAFAVGAVFAWLTEHAGGLTAPIAAHFTINAANLYWVGRPRWWDRR